MHDPNSLREQARRCRALSKTAVEPEVIEQLRVWAVDLAEEADQAERRDVERERLTEKVEDAVLNWSLTGTKPWLRDHQELLVIEGSKKPEDQLWCGCRVRARQRIPSNGRICPSPTAGAALYSSSNAANTWVWPAAQGGAELRSGAVGALREA